MDRMNRDAAVAIALLIMCGIFFWASFDIRQPDYGVLMPSTWPRIILAILTGLSLVYLFQSLTRPEETAEDNGSAREPGFMGWLSYWRNPLWCFALFFAYLLTLPVLGMLIGGISFVFLLLGVLGGWEPRKLALHSAIAVLSVGSMWALFTFGLGVILPPGVIFSPFG